MKKINVFRWLLFPFAWLYGVVGWIRNKLYDWKLLKITAFEGVRLIGVGNLSSGGTGKTPHVEYLVRQLKDTYKAAIVSRGYKRKTKGFVLADAKTTALEIGDEPMQMYRKFAKYGVEVAVCENRVEGVRRLLELKPDIEVIVLDDVFQHRRIKVDTLILLTDFRQLFTEDYVLPMGNLREFRGGYKRADVIVVTKYPDDLLEKRKEEIIERIQPLAHQKVLFSYLRYGEPYSFFDNPQNIQHPPTKPIPLAPPSNRDKLFKGGITTLDWGEVDAVLVVCGIAKPERMVEHVRTIPIRSPRINSWAMDSLFFGDHHDFSVKDLELIRVRFEGLVAKYGHVVILTTEKDMVRLELWREELEGMGLLGKIFVLGIEVDFGDGEGVEAF